MSVIRITLSEMGTIHLCVAILKNILAKAAEGFSMHIPALFSKI
ncbi:MAG: hypothetical protein ACTSQO_15055 [Candidatus Helarchaeota archaeon]